MFKITRLKYNINQNDMAKILKVTQSMISQYESRLKKPNLYTLYRFAKAFSFKDLENELKQNSTTLKTNILMKILRTQHNT